MATMVGCSSCGLLFIRTPPLQPKSPSVVLATAGKGTRRALSLFLLLNWIPSPSPAAAAHIPDFEEIPYSGGVKALQLRIGSGTVPDDGDKVAIHYYARLAAKQGWRFDSTYDHKDETGDSIPFVFTLGSPKVIPGIQAAVKSMKVGGIQRVVIPPSQGYQNTSQEPLPPNVSSYASNTEL
uniref:peptidylprolyl isomerase n=1 Tax=Kalanchoe fedtschenkoi TaxID=63787 RepID=A0A7N0TK27_KALFE